MIVLVQTETSATLPLGNMAQVSASLENHMGHGWERMMATSVEAEMRNAVTVRTHAKHQQAAKSCLKVRLAQKYHFV